MPSARGSQCSPGAPAEHVDDRDRRWRRANDGLEQIDELDLSFALVEDPEDPTCAGIERSEQVECALADVLVLDHVGPAPGLRGPSSRCQRPRLERRLLVERQHPLVRAELACVQVADVVDGLAEPIVARDLRAQPVVYPPWLELLRRNDPMYRRCRDRINDALSDQCSCQLGAGPGRQRARPVLGQLAGELDEVCRHDRGERGGRPLRGASSRPRSPRSMKRSAHFERSAFSALRAAPPRPARRHRPASGSCPHHISVRQHHRSGDVLEHDPLLPVEGDLQRRLLGLRLLRRTELDPLVGSRPSDDDPACSATGRNRSRNLLGLADHQPAGGCT